MCHGRVVHKNVSKISANRNIQVRQNVSFFIRTKTPEKQDFAKYHGSVVLENVSKITAKGKPKT